MKPFATDTSALLRLLEPNHPLRDVVQEAIASRLERGGSLVYSHQVLTEFWVVATRPVEVNGLGMTAQVADMRITDLLRLGRVAAEPATAFDRWRRLVNEANIVGKRAHDARLAAFLTELGVPELITLNPRDFARFNGVAGIDLELIVPAA